LKAGRKFSMDDSRGSKEEVMAAAKKRKRDAWKDKKKEKKAVALEAKAVVPPTAIEAAAKRKKRNTAKKAKRQATTVAQKEEGGQTGKMTPIISAPVEQKKAIAATEAKATPENATKGGHQIKQLNGVAESRVLEGSSWRKAQGVTVSGALTGTYTHTH
jgi:hypothetical protein